MFPLTSENSTTTTQDRFKQCLACGKYFKPAGRNAKRQKFCKFAHFATCPVCGFKFEVSTSQMYVDKDSNKLVFKKTCCKECANKLKVSNLQKSMEAKYGVDNPSQVEAFREKRENRTS